MTESTEAVSTETVATDSASTDTGSTETGSTETGQRNDRKVREGLVVSDKMQKTVVVEVEDRVQHPRYGKTVRRSHRLKAHDQADECGVGDRVRLMETRPLSAGKRWRVVEIIERAK